MKVMTETSDGFIISKRTGTQGSGDFFGTRQHGIPELKIANLYKDMDILKNAQEAAEALIRDDRTLKEQENRLLRRAISEKFSGIMDAISMN